MTDIPDEAVEAAARALFVMQHRVDVSCFDKASYEALAAACIREAKNALKAAAPIIRADERRRVAEEIRAAAWPTDKADTEGLDFGYALGRNAGLDIAAQIAERSGK